MSTLRSLVAAAGIAGATYGLAACTDASPTQPMAHDLAAHASAPLADRSNAHMGAMKGTTGGWSDGRNVTFFYNKPFFCAQPPASGATTGCALGAEPTQAPRGGPIPVLYVMVPLGFTPDRGTLQCPEAGACINHPSTIDLSRVFGAGTENALLPPHSHIVGREEGSAAANAGWWEIEVVGVTSPAAWQRLVDGKSLATLRALQAANDGVTGDIPSNLYLFFGVRG
jgi:hypothetical protein